MSRLFLILLVTVSVFGSASAQTQEWILPVVVDGAVGKPAHFQTTFRVVNLSASATRWTLTSYDNSGKSVEVFCPRPGPPIGPPPEPILAANGVVEFTTGGTGDNNLLVNGWARLTSEGPAALQAGADITLVATAARGCPPLPICARTSQEIFTSANVTAVRPAREFRAIAVITPNRETAYALVNPSATQKARVVFKVLDDAGQSREESAFEIAPLQRLSRFLFELMIIDKTFIQQPMRPDFLHGSVVVSSDVPIALAALNVLLPEGKLVNVPVSALP